MNPIIAMTGSWVVPENPAVSEEHWLTRRRQDCAPGYDLGLPDIRVQYLWNPESECWVTGYYQGTQRPEAILACMHSNNGWRLAPMERAAE